MQNRHGYDSARIAHYPTDILQRIVAELQRRAADKKRIMEAPPDMNSKHVAVFEWQSLIMCAYRVNCELSKRSKLQTYSDPQADTLLNAETNN